MGASIGDCDRRRGWAPSRHYSREILYLQQVNKPLLDTQCSSSPAGRLWGTESAESVPALELISLTGKSRQAH